MDEYDLIAIGGGSGSQVATAAAERGLETAVIERGPLGGACVTRGCVPSKALIHRADLVEDVRRAGEFGISARLEDVAYDEITSSIRDNVYEKAERQEASLEENENVTLRYGEASFVDDRTLEIDLNDGSSAAVRGETVVIAVGGRPMIPPVDGLEDVDFLTSDDALFLDTRPDSLAIIGGGYIGAELGYFFGALGTDVSMIGRSERLVPEEDDDVSEVVTTSMERYGEIYTGYEAVGVEQHDGEVRITAEPVGDEDGDAIELAADELLLATGRRPNTDTLNLGETGIETDDGEHVVVDQTLETTVDDVWALGDIVGEQPFKHAADYEARVVSTNVLGGSEARSGSNSRAAQPRDGADREVDYSAMPHAIFTEPQVASVGRTEGELEDEAVEYESVTVPYDAAPLGMIFGADDGFVKVLAAPDAEILGCHVVGPQASTLIQEVVVAMDRADGTVEDVAEPVHVHPALSEVLYAAFDELSASRYSTAPDWREVGDG